MKLVDTHCHLDYEGYGDSLDKVINESKELDFVINVGCCVESSKANLELAEKHDFMYSSVGVHPNYSKDFTNSDIDSLEEMLKSNKVKAIGEIGLDYYRDYVLAEKQKEAFRKQLYLAKKHNLPVIIHGRNAYRDIFEILEEKDFVDIRIIMHSYQGSYEEVEKYLDRFYISFSGMVTFKKALDVQDCAIKVPMDRILIETDSPFLTPEPFRGREKNRPILVKEIAKKISQLKNMDYDEFVKKVNVNARDAFNIK